MIRAVISIPWIPCLLMAWLHGFQLGFPDALGGIQTVVCTTTLWLSFSIYIIHRTGWKSGLDMRIHLRGGSAKRGVPALIDTILEPAHDELRILRGEIARVKGLVHDAFEELNLSFVQINDRGRGQEQTAGSRLDRLEAAGIEDLDDYLTRCPGEVSRTTTDLDSDIHVAIRSLQLEDLTREVLDKATRHSRRLEASFDDVRLAVAERDDIDIARIERDLEELHAQGAEEIHRVADQHPN